MIKPYDACKVLTNRVVSWSARKSYCQNPIGHAIFLDNSRLSTTSMLHGVSIPKKNMISPNTDSDVCNNLALAGVSTYHGTWEESLKHAHLNINTIYYDGCGSLVGNKGKNIYVGNSLDKALEYSIKSIDQMVTFAFTVCLSGQKLPFDISVSEATSHQMLALIEKHGYILNPNYDKIEIAYSRPGGALMGFYCWPLQFVKDISPRPFLKWDNGRRIGFRD